MIIAEGIVGKRVGVGIVLLLFRGILGEGFVFLTSSEDAFMCFF